MTAVFEVPLTVAVNCWVWPGVRVAEGGETETPMSGDTVTVELPDFVGSAILVAVTVTVRVEVTLGAV